MNPKKLIIFRPKVLIKYQHNHKQQSNIGDITSQQQDTTGTTVKQQNYWKGDDDSGLNAVDKSDDLAAKLNEILFKDGKLSVPKLKLVDDIDLDKFDNNCHHKIYCTQCKRLFNDKSAYLTHVERHRRDNSVQCHYCGLLFADLYKFLEHEFTHTQREPFACQQCGIKFISYDYFRMHRRNHKTGTYKSVGDRTLKQAHITPMSCLFCCEKFATTKELKEHEYVHYVTCPVCGINAHYSDEQFRCLECKSSFYIQRIK